MHTKHTARSMARRIIVAFIAAGALAACQAAPSPIPEPSPDSTPVAVSPAQVVTNRIAIIDAGGTIYAVDPDGGDRVDLNSSGTIPDAAVAWAPDGSRLAFSLVTSQDSQLVTVDARGAQRTHVYRDSPAAVPFYLSWAPDSQHLAFLTTQPQSRMALQFARADEAESTRLITRGQPNYFSWSPEGERLAVHIGGTTGYVGTYKLGDEATLRRDAPPAFFQAPARAPIGAEYLFARAGASSPDELVLARDDDDQTLASFQGGAVFGWSPDGTQVAFGELDRSSLQYTRLSVVGVDGGNARRIVVEPYLAFFWSPDGRQIAYLTGQLVSPGSIGRAPSRQGLAAPRVDQTQRVLELTWNTVDVGSGRKSALASFVPTDQFLFVVPYFDQYAQSLSFWSPDSRYLLVAGAPLARDTAIYRVDTQAESDRLTRIGPGQFAVWSWR